MSCKVQVCDECAVVVSNDDWSAFDLLDKETANELIASIEGSLETLGYLAYAGTGSQGGYWQCELCGYDQIGDANLYESSRASGGHL